MLGEYKKETKILIDFCFDSCDCLNCRSYNRFLISRRNSSDPISGSSASVQNGSDEEANQMTDSTQANPTPESNVMTPNPEMSQLAQNLVIYITQNNGVIISKPVKNGKTIPLLFSSLQNLRS